MEKQKQPKEWVPEASDNWILKSKTSDEDWVPKAKEDDKNWGTNLEKTKKEGWGS